MDQPLRQAGSAAEWANQSMVHPVGLIALLALGLAMLAVPRRFALLPMLMLACFVPSAQRVVVVSLDFDFLRLMVLFGWARVLLRNEGAGFVWRPLDWALIAWAIVGTIAYSLLHGTPEALVNRLGQSFDAVGMYFLFRVLIRTWPDLLGVIKALAILAIPVAVAFVVEQVTARNAFSVFGGVPAITDVREGRLRCQGAFSHPILAGCFWASVLPLMVGGLWQRGMPTWTLVAGIGSALIIIGACASSTPIMAVLFGGLGGAMFLMRGSMRTVRWSIVFVLLGLHLVMNKPVWHLMARVDIVNGSTGWHRYLLVNETINHFGEWALIGTTGTSQWGPNMQDITNQYILEAISGGLLTVVIFVVMIALAFGGVGRMWRANRGDRALLYMSWAIGVSLFVHCCNFLAVSYFGQVSMLWYLSLGIIGSLAPHRSLAWTPSADAHPRTRQARLVHHTPAVFGPSAGPFPSRGSG